jgi:hypothetical protein
VLVSDAVVLFPRFDTVAEAGGSFGADVDDVASANVVSVERHAERHGQSEVDGVERFPYSPFADEEGDARSDQDAVDEVFGRRQRLTWALVYEAFCNRSVYASTSAGGSLGAKFGRMAARPRRRCPLMCSPISGATPLASGFMVMA